MAGATPEIWEWTFLTPELPQTPESRLKSQAISLGNSTGNQPESQELQVEILLHCTEEDKQAAIPTDPYRFTKSVSYLVISGAGPWKTTRCLSYNSYFPIPDPDSWLGPCLILSKSHLGKDNNVFPSQPNFSDEFKKNTFHFQEVLLWCYRNKNLML